eukprot:5284485-Prymnesium_polylepis.1
MIFVVADLMWHVGRKVNDPASRALMSNLRIIRRDRERWGSWTCVCARPWAACPAWLPTFDVFAFVWSGSHSHTVHAGHAAHG